MCGTVLIGGWLWLRMRLLFSRTGWTTCKGGEMNLFFLCEVRAFCSLSSSATLYWTALYAPGTTPLRPPSQTGGEIGQRKRRHKRQKEFLNPTKQGKKRRARNLGRNSIAHVFFFQLSLSLSHVPSFTNDDVSPAPFFPLFPPHQQAKPGSKNVACAAAPQ